MISAESADRKAEVLQSTLMKKLDEFMPEKIFSFSSDDQPFFTPELKNLDKKRKREYRRHRRSYKWSALNKDFKNKLKVAKASFYEKKIQDLKQGEPGQWYTKLKRLCSYDQNKSGELVCEEIREFSNQQQAELLADRFAGVSNEYDKIQEDKLIIPPGQIGDLPQFSIIQVLENILKLKTNKSTVPGDIPAIIIKKYAQYICVPLTHIINYCITKGEYPKLWKIEVQTPIPKEYPPLKMDMLRNVSNLKNLDKVFQSMLGQLIVKDMEAKLDPSQYGKKTRSVSPALFDEDDSPDSGESGQQPERRHFCSGCQFNRLETSVSTTRPNNRCPIIYRQWCPRDTSTNISGFFQG